MESCSYQLQATGKVEILFFFKFLQDYVWGTLITWFVLLNVVPSAKGYYPWLQDRIVVLSIG